jgi:sulfur carrier protein
MQLHVNGEIKQCADGLSLRQALETWGYAPKSIAVALNGQFIPKHLYDSQALHDQHELEIVAPMQGG